MTKIISLSVLALCALVLPTNGQVEPLSASVKTGGAGSGSPNTGSQWLPTPGGPGSRRRCPRGKVYKECVSSTCGEYKCKYLYRFRERKCTADCRSGCFCAWPFFKNNDGRCVPFWQCYTYRFGRWFGRRPSAGMNQGSGQPGSSVSASGPGASGAVSVPQPGGSSSVGSQVPGGSNLLPGQVPGSSPGAPGWQPQGGWGSTNGLENGGWTSGPNEYLGHVWGVPTSGYPNEWRFGNGNGDSGGINGNFVGESSGPGIGIGGVGNGISGVGSGNGGFGNDIGIVGNGISGVGSGSGGFESVSTGFPSGNTGFGSSSGGVGIGNAGFFGNDLGSGPGGVTSNRGVFGPGNITPGTAKGLA
uniref:Putative monotil peptide n=1 Tax=Rhipicephalus pulchellus TaxID=72859 RepID=L7LTS4_RHIPC